MIVERMADRSAVLMPSIAVLRSPKMDCRSRMLPDSSNAVTPNPARASAALSVGAVKLVIILRSFVPPSDPFMPLSAKRPRAVLSSVIPSSVPPPLSIFAVPPTVRIASPNCSTLVFAFEAVCAMLSEKPVRFCLFASMPRALMLSVTMSEAAARSIAPAPARFRTVGRASAALSASYPAKAK